LVLFKNVITAAECGAALVLTLEDRQTQLGSWGRCHAVYIRTLDINRGMKWWEQEDFQKVYKSISAKAPGAGMRSTRSTGMKWRFVPQDDYLPPPFSRLNNLRHVETKHYAPLPIQRLPRPLGPRRPPPCAWSCTLWDKGLVGWFDFKPKTDD
jgi:hypothetical protein